MVGGRDEVVSEDLGSLVVQLPPWSDQLQKKYLEKRCADEALVIVPCVSWNVSQLLKDTVRPTRYIRASVAGGRANGRLQT